MTSNEGNGTAGGVGGGFARALGFGHHPVDVRAHRRPGAGIHEVQTVLELRINLHNLRGGERRDVAAVAVGVGDSARDDAVFVLDLLAVLGIGDRHAVRVVRIEAENRHTVMGEKRRAAHVVGLERLCEPAVFDPETTQRVFRIASRGLVEPSLLTYPVSRFMREASKAKLEHIYRSEDSFGALVTGELGAVVSTDIAVPPSLHCLPLFPIELGVMISKHHPLVTASRGKAPALVQLLAYRRIGLKVSPNAESSTFDRQVFGEEGKDALIAETDEPLAMVSVVAETDAVMVAPKAGVNLASRFF